MNFAIDFWYIYCAFFPILKLFWQTKCNGRKNYGNMLKIKLT